MPGLSSWSHYYCCCLVPQSCPTLCDTIDCSLLGSSVRGIFQARILEWIAISFSRGCFQPRDRTHLSCLAGRFFTPEPPGKLPIIALCYLFFFFHLIWRFLKTILCWSWKKRHMWREKKHKVDEEDISTNCCRCTCVAVGIVHLPQITSGKNLQSAKSQWGEKRAHVRVIRHTCFFWVGAEWWWVGTDAPLWLH